MFLLRACVMQASYWNVIEGAGSVCRFGGGNGLGEGIVTALPILPVSVDGKATRREKTTVRLHNFVPVALAIDRFDRRIGHETPPV